MSKAFTIEEALKGGKNISTGDVVSLLKSFGFVYDEGKRVNWSHPEYPDLTFNLDMKRREADTRAVKTAGQRCQEVQERKSRSMQQSAQDLPKWVDLPSGYEASIAADKVTIWDRNHPEAQMRFSLNDASAPSYYHANLEAFKKQLDRYGHVLADLDHHYGFVFSNQGGDLVVSQPDYGISHRFTPATIDTLIEQIKQVEQEAEVAVEADYGVYNTLAKIEGISLSRRDVEGGVEVTVSHPNLFAPTTLMLLGNLERMDETTREHVEAVIKAITNPKQEVPAPAEAMPPQPEAVQPVAPAQEEKPEEAHTPPPAAEVAQAPEVAPEEATVVEPERAPVVVSSSPSVVAEPVYQSSKPLVPEEKTAAIVLDTNIINELAVAARQGGRTWLDLLPLIADMPGIDKIYVPASVADWELRGKITKENGQSLQIDHRYADRRYKELYQLSTSADALLNTASRSSIDSDGKRHLVSGSNPNIVIYETDVDRRFMNGIQAIYEDRAIPFSSKGEVYRRLMRRFVPESTSIDLGEYSMQQVGQEIEGKPVYLCSNDINYFKNCGTLVNNSGMPVGKMTLPGLLRSCLAVDNIGLKERLEQHFGASVPEFDVQTIKDAVLAAGQHDQKSGYPNGYAEVTPGMVGDEVGETLEQILLNAAAIVRGDAVPIAPSIPAMSIKPAATVSVQEKPKEETNVMTQEMPAPAPYEQTFGYQVGMRRIERRMTEAELAEHVRELAEKRPSVDEDTVYRWQSNQELPSAEMYDVLEQILVHENDAITDKDAVKKAFRAAYEVSLNASQDASAYQTPDAHKQASYAFANELRKLRKSAGLTDDDALAQKIVGAARSDIEEKPEEIDAPLMLKISANAYRPSLGMVRAIVKVLRESRDLSDQGVQELYDAYHANKSAATWASNVEAQREAQPNPTELKKQLMALFTRDGKQLKAIDLVELTNIKQHDISNLLGPKTPFPPKMSQERLQSSGEALRAGLQQVNPDALAQFDELFGAYVAAANAARGRQ